MTKLSPRTEVCVVVCGDGVNGSSQGVEFNVMLERVVLQKTTAQVCAAIVSSVAFAEVRDLQAHLFSSEFFHVDPDWGLFDLGSHRILNPGDPLPMQTSFPAMRIGLISRAKKNLKVIVALDTCVIHDMSISVFRLLASLGSDVLQFYIPHMVIQELDRAAKKLSALGKPTARGYVLARLKEFNDFCLTHSNSQDATVIIGNNLELDSCDGRNNDNIILKSLVGNSIGHLKPYGECVFLTSDIALSVRASAHLGKEFSAIFRTLDEVAQIPFIDKMIKRVLSRKNHLEIRGVPQEYDEARMINVARAFSGGVAPASIIWEMVVVGEHEGKVRFESVVPRVFVGFADEKTCEAAILGFRTRTVLGKSFQAKLIPTFDNLPATIFPLDHPLLESTASRKEETGVVTTVQLPMKENLSNPPTAPFSLDRQLSDPVALRKEETSVVTVAQLQPKKDTSPSSLLLSIDARHIEGGIIKRKFQAVVASNVVVIHGFPIGCHGKEVASTISRAVSGSGGRELLAQMIGIGKGPSLDYRGQPSGLMESKVFVEFADSLDAQAALMNIPKMQYNGSLLNATRYKVKVAMPGHKPVAGARFAPLDPQNAVVFFGVPAAVNSINLREFIGCALGTKAPVIVSSEIRKKKGSIEVTVFLELSEARHARALIELSKGGELCTEIWGMSVSLRCFAFCNNEKKNDAGNC